MQPIEQADSDLSNTAAGYLIFRALSAPRRAGARPRLMSATLVLAIVFGLCLFAVLIQQVSRSRFERGLAISLLRPSQRREIWRSVTRGVAVDDPALAQPAVQLARALEQRPTPRSFFQPGRSRVVVTVVLGAVTVFNLVVTHWLAALGYGLFVVCIVFSEEVVWAPQRRKRAASIVANSAKAL